MTTLAIRQKLADYIKIADDKKVKAVYALLEEDMEQEAMKYTNEFKAELDERHSYYLSGGKMVTAENANKQIVRILQSGKGK